MALTLITQKANAHARTAADVCGYGHWLHSPFLPQLLRRFRFNVFPHYKSCYYHPEVDFYLTATLLCTVLFSLLMRLLKSVSVYWLSVAILKKKRSSNGRGAHVKVAPVKKPFFMWPSALEQYDWEESKTLAQTMGNWARYLIFFQYTGTKYRWVAVWANRMLLLLLLTNFSVFIIPHDFSSGAVKVHPQVVQKGIQDHLEVCYKSIWGRI